MRKSVMLVGLLVLALVVAACGGGSPAGPAGLTGADRSAINAALDRWVSAFEDMDAAGLATIFAPQVTVVEPTGTQVVRRDDLEQTIEDSFAGTVVHEAAFLNRHITGSGDTAIVSMTWYLHTTVFGTEGKSTVEMEWRFRKSGGVWRADRIEAK